MARQHQRPIKYYKIKGVSRPGYPCQCGGVTVSYFEWVQDIQYYFWSEEDIQKKLKDVMVGTFNRVLALSNKKGIDMRTAASDAGHRACGRGKETAGIIPLINIFISTVIVLWKYLKIDNTKTLLLKKVLIFPSKTVWHLRQLPGLETTI